VALFESPYRLDRKRKLKAMTYRSSCSSAGVRSGLSLFSVLAISYLAVACGGEDPALPPTSGVDLDGTLGPVESQSSLDEAGHRDEFPEPAPLVSARLDVDGEALVLQIQNLTDVAGTVHTSALVDNPEALFFTENARDVAFGPNESLAIRLSPSDVEGLDLEGHEWTDARINFQVDLADGRRGGDYESVFTEYGQLAPAREVVSSGVSYGVPEPEFVEEPLVDKQAATFSVCFSHAITFSAADLNNIDFFKAAGPHTVNASNIFVQAVVGSTSFAQFADSNGCTTYPRTAGNWTFTLSLDSQGFPVSNMIVSALKAGGGFPTKAIGPFAVTSTTSTLGRKTFTMSSGADSDLQTAYVVAQHTLRRAMSLGTIAKSSDILTIKLATTTEYLHASRTVLVTNGTARTRGGTAHEVGHWIHRGFMTATSTGSNNTYCTAGGTPSCTVPPADGCSRTPAGSHGQDMIEWESLAHLEGIADFFRMLAFNNTTEEAPSGGANCLFPGATAAAPNRLFNCESAGMYMKTGTTTGGNCFEWTRAIFTSVGNEYDWAKMYWDLFADETGLGASRLRDYMLIEQAVTSWGTTDHVDKLLAAMAGKPMDAAFRRAAAGNIFDGTAH
jgi:hypothetical protein